MAIPIVKGKDESKARNMKIETRISLAYFSFLITVFNLRDLI